ncbi:MAG: NADH-quinone oxidoreductase subunit NuoE [Dehalococcoidia bacterium]|nr:MAG: NADH-quinone oxidoreductase subunit NuoE [Dehalococcoidia bacterium]
MSLAETEVKDKLDEILSHHTGKKEELIPILQEAQEQFGYLPSEVMLKVAKFLRLPESAIFGVSTFYAQFKFLPTGRKKVRLCRGTACHVRGAPRILDEVEKQLGIKPGETTDDLEYSLETIACFGSCALAPVMVVDDDVYGRMTPKKVAQILGNAKST